MANVSSSNGIEKCPKLRFNGFSNTWTFQSAESLFENITDKNHPEETVLTIIQGSGTLPRGESSRNIRYDESGIANYKKVQTHDYIIHLRSFEGGLEMANSTGIISPAYTVLRPKEKVAPLFYDAYFHTDEFINHILAKSVEGIRDGRQISYEAFKWLKIPTCSFEEQNKIAELFRVLAIRINKQRELVSTLKKYKRGMIRSIFSDISSWKEYSISNVGTVITGNTPPTQNPDNYMGDRLFCAPGDLGHSKYIASTEKNISETALNKNRKIPKGSILVTCIGSTIGKMGIAGEEMLTNQQINSVIVSKDHCNEFVYYTLEYYFPQFISHVGKQAVPILSKGQFENLRISLPSIEVQRNYSSILASFDIKIEKAAELLQHLQKYKSGLLQQLFI